MSTAIIDALRNWLRTDPSPQKQLVDPACLSDWNAPDLCRPDGLMDYAGDYSDEATRPSADDRSVYRIGIGLVDDEEQARWLQLGKPRGQRSHRAITADLGAPAALRRHTERS
ncbi:MAG: hypothetical protein AB7O57_16190 [Hyphomicrobiaceae bacterium]